MNGLLAWAHRLRRRLFGKIVVIDPRPIAETAPYTYFLPSENELLAICAGDLVKIVVASIPRSRDYEAERLWFSVRHADGAMLTARLDNEPCDIPQLSLGQTLSFDRHRVIDIIWADDRSSPPPARPPRREYWARCLVDRCVLEDGVQIGFIYREEPEPTTADETWPDSGWRIRGDYRDISDEELAKRDIEYVALGVVLNRDDSWLPLIDEPTGSAFVRDWDRGIFVAEDLA